jgi:anti-sigma regulatory factor (Ser/Thr protein kinase)
MRNGVHQGRMQEYLTVELPAKPESAEWSREALREFRDRLEDDAFIDLQLVVSELVADAVRSEEKGSRPIVLRFEVNERHLRVEVSDGAAAYELRPRRPELGERGWGVYLTRVLAQHWGSLHDDSRGSVWVEMPLAGSA